jgi:hypothetical protein
MELAGSQYPGNLCVAGTGCNAVDQMWAILLSKLAQLHRCRSA